ncbi:MAG: sigma-54 dependent transcriptional regulator, partial [Halofilum sp. (in: g-proteobacteria)]
MSSPSVLVVDDEPDIRELLREILEEEGYQVAVAADAQAARRARDAHGPDLALLDIWMPDIDGITLLKEWHCGPGPGFPVIMMSGHGTIETAVEATRHGAYDYIEKPLSLARLLATVRAALGSGDRRLAAAAARAPRTGRVELVGASPALTALRERVERFSRAPGPVLVRGEPGAGKRTVAGLLHQQGRRPRGPYVDFDLGGIGEASVGERLFGEGGAWAQAVGGTLVVHDLAELGQEEQAVLYERLQSADHQPDAPRVVAVSAERLEALVEARRLRPDLFHLLNGVALLVPPLREHAEDVPELLGHFVGRLVEREGLTYRHFSVAAQNRLRHHEWFGNVAELEALVRRLLTLGDGADIDDDEVGAVLDELRAGVEVPATAMPLPLDLPLREARDAFERAYLQHQLRAVGGRIGELARRVGMERTHLYRKLRSLG